MTAVQLRHFALYCCIAILGKAMLYRAKNPAIKRKILEEKEVLWLSSQVIEVLVDMQG